VRLSSTGREKMSYDDNMYEQKIGPDDDDDKDVDALIEVEVEVDD